ncbi:MAG TPA: ABC transporter ATP-binding protein [Verrucomicrobiae bacterium]|nr:ABC transporter ATP-binding protein [Verrucomicrobiae bacterium]
MSAVIQLAGVSKVYDSGGLAVQALDEVSLHIEAGEFVALMGASGSGKSTLMNILGCLDRPTDGRYLLQGVDVSDLDTEELADIRNEQIGFVFQNFHLFSRTSALENIELPLLYRHQRRLSARKQRKMAQEALEMVGLTDRADHHPNQLSGGQQQRVAIARALVNGPELVLADEPTGNLDTRTSEEIMAVLQSLNRRGITIVLVTHEPDVARHARRSVTLRDGRITSDELAYEAAPGRPAWPSTAAMKLGAEVAR